MPQLTIGEFSLHYERSGVPGAQPLVFSNSLGATLQVWEPQLAVFEKRYDVIRYDMRGHGMSSVPQGPYLVEQLSNDVLGLIDELRLNDVIFCGLSIGGAIGQWLAMHAPERFRCFVLSNTAAKFGTLERWTQRIAAVEQGGLAAVVDAIVNVWFTEAYRTTNPETIARIGEMILSCNPLGYVAACAAVRDVDFREAVTGIRKPVCIVAGQHDTSTTMEEAWFLHRSIEGSKFVELPAAHISNVEAPAKFNAAVFEFLHEQGFYG